MAENDPFPVIGLGEGLTMLSAYTIDNSESEHSDVEMPDFDRNSKLTKMDRELERQAKRNDGFTEIHLTSEENSTRTNEADDFTMPEAIIESNIQLRNVNSNDSNKIVTKINNGNISAVSNGDKNFGNDKCTSEESEIHGLEIINIASTSIIQQTMSSPRPVLNISAHPSNKCDTGTVSSESNSPKSDDNTNIMGLQRDSLCMLKLSPLRKTTHMCKLDSIVQNLKTSDVGCSELQEDVEGSLVEVITENTALGSSSLDNQIQTSVLNSSGNTQEEDNALISLFLDSPTDVSILNSSENAHKANNALVANNQNGISLETDFNTDVFIDRRSRKNPYIENFTSDSESDSYSQSSDIQILSKSSDDTTSSDEAPTPVRKNLEKLYPEKQKKKPPPQNKTRGELALEDLPPIEDLYISVPESDIRKIGIIHSIVDTQVIVQSFPNESPYDLDSVLFLSDGKALGKVFDVFGKVTSPLYSVRFNSKESIINQGICIGDAVFSAPEHKDVTIYVFTDDLKKLKGSDASWEHNNEPPVECQDFSDDEAEKMFKQKLRAKHKSRNIGEGEEAGTPIRKQKFPNSRDLPLEHFLRPQTFQNCPPNSGSTQNTAIYPTNQPHNNQQSGPRFHSQSPNNPFNNSQKWGHHSSGSHPRNTFQAWRPFNLGPGQGLGPGSYQQNFPPPVRTPPVQYLRNSFPNGHNQSSSFNSGGFASPPRRFEPLEPPKFQHGFPGQQRPPFFAIPHVQNGPPFDFGPPPPYFRTPGHLPHNFRAFGPPETFPPSGPSLPMFRPEFHNIDVQLNCPPHSNNFPLN